MSNLETSRNMSDIERIWVPLDIFACSRNVKYAVVVLNNVIDTNWKMLLQLWRSAQVKMTVDGGTDQWLHFVCHQTQCTIDNVDDIYLPDMITGDFDSILPATLNKIYNLNLKVIKTPDQNETDYTKALRQLRQHCICNEIQLDYVYVICDTSGRFDQIIANVNTLYKSPKILDENTSIIQITNDSLIWLLSKGKHKIEVPEFLITGQSWCSLMAFGNSDNCVSTTGLKWNLDKQCLKFGELVSTSNTYTHNEITINTNDYIVWSMDIKSFILNKESKRHFLV